MISIRNLTKRYGNLTAVDDLSFEVQAGQVLGFLGPNGAGKSTTMKMIAGFLAPTAGEIHVCGVNIENKPLIAKQAIGYLPEGAPSYGEMTVAEFLGFVADVRGLKGSARSDSMQRVSDDLNLQPVSGQTIDTLSKGFRRRVGLAQALLHDPQVLILDEPTDGLDPNQKHEVRSLINSMAQDKIVIVSTHILEEVEAVCDRAIIIANGRIQADATPQELEAKSEFHNAVRLRVTGKGVDEALRRVPAVIDVRREGEAYIAMPRSGQNPYLDIVQLAQQQGWDVSELTVERGRLDDVFREITLGEGKGVAA